MRCSYTAAFMRIFKVALVLNNHASKTFLHSLNKISRQQSIKRNISKAGLRSSGMLYYVTSQKSEALNSTIAEAWKSHISKKIHDNAQTGGSIKKKKVNLWKQRDGCTSIKGSKSHDSPEWDERQESCSLKVKGMCTFIIFICGICGCTGWTAPPNTSSSPCRRNTIIFLQQNDRS